MHVIFNQGVPVNESCAGAEAVLGNHVGDWERNVLRFRVSSTFIWIIFLKKEFSTYSFPYPLEWSAIHDLPLGT